MTASRSRASSAGRVVATWAVLCATSSCARSSSSIGRAPSPTPMVGGWSYEVVVSAHADELAIAARFPASSDTRLVVLEEVRGFVADVVVTEGERETAVSASDGMWIAPSCARGCLVRYRFALRQAAQRRHDRTLADTFGEGIVAPLSSWLLRPLQAAPQTPYRLAVHTPPTESFVAPLAAIAPQTFVGHTQPGYALPLAVFGTFAAERHGRVQLAFPHRSMRHPDALGGWIDDANRAIDGYFGALPAPPVMLLLEPFDGDRVGFGTAMSWSGPLVEINIGRDVTRASLHRDWTLTHELVHTTLPRLADEHHWLEEGLATYVEPFARARRGLTSEKKVWSDFVEGLPNGLPADGDEGLDRTHTWGRTYWGGALFCLLADLEIRARTKNQKTLDDALKAIVAEGGRIDVEWPIDRFLAIGDRATGTTALADLYEQHARRKQDVDLPALWKKLGVIARGESVDFDDGAELAAVRRSMVAPASK